MDIFEHLKIVLEASHHRGQLLLETREWDEKAESDYQVAINELVLRIEELLGVDEKAPDSLEQPSFADEEKYVDGTSIDLTPNPEGGSLV